MIAFTDAAPNGAPARAIDDELYVGPRETRTRRLVMCDDRTIVRRIDVVYEFEDEPKRIRHGTLTAYSARGCRCSCCVVVGSAHSRENKRKHAALHLAGAW